MADWISLREMARRRSCTLAAVQKAIATGRITAAAVRRDANGRLQAIDADQAAIDWYQNTDAELALRTGTLVPQPASIEAPTRHEAQRVSDDAAGTSVLTADSAAPHDREGTVPSPGAPKLDEFQRDRARNERIKAINAELDLALRLKTLVSADDVRRASFDAARTAQEALMRLPDRLSPLLAAETDAARIRALLDQAIREALHGLAERAEQLAAA